MPQVVELPPIGQALTALVKVCKDTPAKGEPFRELRSGVWACGDVTGYQGVAAAAADGARVGANVAGSL